MSNVIQLAGNDRRISNKIHVDNLRSDEPEGVRFPLVVKDLHVRKPSVVSYENGGYDTFPKLQSTTKALFNGHTGQEIGLIGGRRQDALAPYGKYLDTVYSVLERCDVNLDGVSGKITLSPDTGSLLGRWRIPNEKFEAPCGDHIVPEIGMTTSLNGKFPFQLGLGCIKIWCNNGMTLFNSNAMLYNHKHDGKLDIRIAAEMLSQTIRSIHREQGLWHRLSNTIVMPNKVWRVMNGIVHGKDAEFDIHELMQESMEGKNKKLNYLRKAWGNYKERLGNNEWALFNLVTDYFTHYPSKTRDLVRLNQSRTSKSREIIEEYLLAA